MPPVTLTTLQLVPYNIAGDSLRFDATLKNKSYTTTIQQNITMPPVTLATLQLVPNNIAGNILMPQV